MLKKILLLLLLCPSVLFLSAQPTEKDNAGGAILVNITYAFQLPSGDLVTRFGSSGGIGGGLEYMTEKHNIILGVEGYVFFGNTVKEDVLINLRGPDDQIIGNNRTYAQVQLRERGFYAGGTIGKLFPLSKSNRRSGIRLTLGAGMLQHKIRIQDDSRSVIQIDENYIKGYDRLSNGLALNQFIGYQYLSKNRRINLTIGFEFTQAFTESRRDFDFVMMAKDERKRTDLLNGIKIGWTLPFYVGEDPETRYY